MVHNHGDRFRPLSRDSFPFQMGIAWLINGGDPNQLLTGMILQVPVFSSLKPWWKLQFLTHGETLHPSDVRQISALKEPESSAVSGEKRWFFGKVQGGLSKDATKMVRLGIP